MEPKQNSFLITLLSILLLISVFIAGFFAYQTQRLVAELRVKNEELIIQTPTPTATPDPTVDWKTYLDTESMFQIKYPKELYLVKQKSNKVNDIDGQILLCTNEISEIKGNNYLTLCGPRIQILSFDYSGNWGGGCIPPGIGEIITVDNKTANACFSPEGGGFYTDNPFNKIPYSISFRYGQNINRDVADSIISTFKFIEPVASSSPLPVACTMEAKICPDGSYVSRSGPRCEFSPCPTPKSVN